MKINPNKLYVVVDPVEKSVSLKIDVFSGEPWTFGEVAKMLSKNRILGIYTTKAEALKEAEKLYPKLMNKPIGIRTLEPTKRIEKFVLQSTIQADRKKVRGWFRSKNMMIRVTPTLKVSMNTIKSASTYLLILTPKDGRQPLMGLELTLEQLRTQVLD